MVSMARPLLADAEFVRKAASGRADEINVCIACNQACLDHTFTRQIASCLVNPRACHETVLNFLPAETRKNIAVAGAGPAGLAFSCAAAKRGHTVTLFESADCIGGQFNMAKRVPGKEEFYETLRYYQRQLELTGVQLRLGQSATVAVLQEFDEIVLATGVKPRLPGIEGITHARVLSYIDVLTGRVEAGERVALVGAGGIGFDVAGYLSQAGHAQAGAAAPVFPTPREFAREWGIDTTLMATGGVKNVIPEARKGPREIWLLQRKVSKPGQGLGKTTGWAHRLSLKNRGVKMIPGVQYQRIDDEGLHIMLAGEARVLAVDHVVICAGQESCRELLEPLQAAKKRVHVIGGADLASELDAKRAIRQGSELAAGI
jgi:2,4-dienoyl-CoA reductase (NADPH2)